MAAYRPRVWEKLPGFTHSGRLAQPHRYSRRLGAGTRLARQVTNTPTRALRRDLAKSVTCDDRVRSPGRKA